jgi:hypothetical protein
MNKPCGRFVNIAASASMHVHLRLTSSQRCNRIRSWQAPPSKVQSSPESYDVAGALNIEEGLYV